MQKSGFRSISKCKDISMQKFWNIFGVLLGVLLLASNSIAQPNEFSTDESFNSRALEFRFGPNFTVGNLNGSAISLKWSGSQNRAHRLGVSFESGLNFGSATESDTELPDISEYDVFFRLHADRIHYYQTNSKIAFYVGYGTRLGFGIDRTEERVEASTDTIIEKTRSLEPGLGVLAGVEWFISRRFSLSGEYGINAIYAITQQNAKENDLESLSRSDRSFQLAGAFPRLRMAIYFQ